ncbi:MAG: nuclear transport factor 2 family protein [Bryobacteraceae bacterium]
MYAAFLRGDVPMILGHLADDVNWETEAPARLSFGGIRRGPMEAAGFFEALAAEHDVVAFEMTEFFEKPDAVAAFGRYEATMKATGKRVNTPVGHYFSFRDGKVTRYTNLINTGAFLEAMDA